MRSRFPVHVDLELDQLQALFPALAYYCGRTCDKYKHLPCQYLLFTIEQALTVILPGRQKVATYRVVAGQQHDRGDWI